MIGKKTHDELLAETPEAWHSHSAIRDGRSPAGDGRENAEGGLRELIARRAYEIYEERGQTHGDDMADWLRAEHEVRLSVGAADESAVEMAKRRRQSAAS